MTWFQSLLSLVHLIGLVLGVGCATAKLALLIRCKSDLAFLPAYIAVSRPVTRLIIVGLVMLTVSGLGWLLLGYPFTTLLVVKMCIVGAIWVLGPLIDNVFEPKFRKLAPAPDESASPAFLRIQQRYLLLEVAATGLFYVIIVIWTLL